MFKYISADEILKSYDMQSLIDAIENGYRLLGEGKITVPPISRIFVNTRDGGNFLFGGIANLATENIIVRGTTFMPWIDASIKTNVVGYYMLISFKDGELKAVIEGKDIVVLRTGAKSAVAVKYLAKENSSTLGLIGLGNQMRTQVEAISKVRNIKKILSWTRNPESHNSTIDYIKSKTGIDVELVEIAEIMKQSDIVVVATHSKEPLINFKDAKAGQLIVSVSHSIEVNDDFVMNSDKVFADYIETAKSEMGPIKSAVDKGLDIGKVSGDLSDLASGKKNGRKNDDEIILFQSLGVMLEDLAAVEMFYQKLK